MVQRTLNKVENPSVKSTFSLRKQLQTFSKVCLCVSESFRVKRTGKCTRFGLCICDENWAFELNICSVGTFLNDRDPRFFKDEA